MLYVIHWLYGMLLKDFPYKPKTFFGKGSYKYYVIRDGVGGGKGKDNTLITCPGQEGGGGR